MLDLRHFFEGALCREETASAFLAMALESSRQFRREFFNLVVPEEADALSGRDWKIRVEMDEMDLRLDADDIVVFIENKISSGAKQRGQLLRYYRQLRANRPSARILAVMLAPGHIGMDEVERVINSPVFGQNDVVKHVSWGDLGQFSPNNADTVEALVGNGLSHVLRVIKKVSQVIYPPEGDRGIIRHLVDMAIPGMQEVSPVPLWRWSGKGTEEIYTVRSNVTVSIAVVFKVENASPFAPIETRDGEGMLTVDIVTWLKISGRARRMSGITQWWEALCRGSHVDVPRVGLHSLDPTKRLAHSENVVCREDQLVQKVTGSGCALLTWVQQQLEATGQSL